MPEYVFKPCVQAEDQEEIVDFLFSLNNIFHFTDRSYTQGVVEYCFEHGGVMGTYVEGKMCAMIGYFIGEEAHNFENKDVAFIYITAISEQYQLTRLFYKGAIWSMKKLREMGMKQIRLQARIGDPYTNKLYARMYNQLDEGKNRRGHSVNNYGDTLDSAVFRLENMGRRK